MLNVACCRLDRTGSREETRCRRIMAVESSLPFIEIPAAAF